jgi:hypothetical protein
MSNVFPTHFLALPKLLAIEHLSALVDGSRMTNFNSSSSQVSLSIQAQSSSSEASAQVNWSTSLVTSTQVTKRSQHKSLGGMW